MHAFCVGSRAHEHLGTCRALEAACVEARDLETPGLESLGTQSSRALARLSRPHSFFSQVHTVYKHIEHATSLRPGFMCFPPSPCNYTITKIHDIREIGWHGCKRALRRKEAAVSLSWASARFALSSLVKL